MALFIGATALAGPPEDDEELAAPTPKMKMRPIMIKLPNLQPNISARLKLRYILPKLSSIEPRVMSRLKC